MSKTGKALLGVLVVLLAGFGIFAATPTGLALLNSYGFAMQKTDDATSYQTVKKVEDTCRAMQASYEADKVSYEQYRFNPDEEKQGWAEQAKLRANRTAANYNEYILKNSFVWNGNVPTDIAMVLQYLE